MLVQLGSKKWNVDIEWLSSHITGTFSKKRTFNPSLTIFANWSRERIQGRVIYDLFFNMRRKMDYFDMSPQWGNFLFILVITLGSFSCSFSQAVATDSNLSIPIPVLESRCILKTWQRLSCGIFALCYVTTCTSRKWRERGSIVMTDNLLNP